MTKEEEQHQVHDTLNAVFKSAVGRLVDMGPWLPVDRGVLVKRQGNVDSVCHQPGYFRLGTGQDVPNETSSSSVPQI